jgi:glycosyltransferase involved in cell wall biosynthesis
MGWTTIIPNAAFPGSLSYSPQVGTREGYPGNLLIYVGRLEKEKGVSLLLRALAILAQDMDVHLWLVGTGREKDRLMREVEALGIGGQVSFLGFRKDTLSLIATADSLVLPSAREGFGNVLVEALSVGTNVVARRSAGPEDILAGNTYGWVCEYGSAPELADGIRESLNSPLPGWFLRDGAKRFSADVISQQYEMLFGSL